MVRDVYNDITSTIIYFSLFFTTWSCTHDVIKATTKGWIISCNKKEMLKCYLLLLLNYNYFFNKKSIRVFFTLCASWHCWNSFPMLLFSYRILMYVTLFHLKFSHGACMCLCDLYQKILYNKENIFSIDNVKTKKQTFIIEPDISKDVGWAWWSYL